MQLLRFSLSRILTGGLLVLSALYLAGVATSLGSLRQSREAVARANAEIRVVLDLVDAINHSRTARVWLLQASSQASVGAFDDANRSIALARSKLDASRQGAQSYLAAVRDPEERRLAEDYRLSYERYIQEGVEPLVRALAEGQPGVYMSTVRDKTMALDRAFEQSLDRSLARRQEVGHIEDERIQSRFDHSLKMTLGLGVLFVALGLILQLGLRRWVLRPLDGVSLEMRQVAEGDLSRAGTPAAAPRVQEIAHMQASLATMRSQLKDTIQMIAAGAQSVSTATLEIASGTLDLSGRTERQAAHVQQTVCTFQSIQGMVDATARAATDADRLMSEAVRQAQAGEHQIARAVDSMVSAKQASLRIREINQLIDALAFQTNLLALNAAVESARAGEHGRGFAVVAAEVRTLARRSSEAARQIGALIGDTQATIEQSSKVVGETGTSIEHMVSHITEVSSLMARIRDATGTQSAHLDAVVTTVGEIDTMTQQNAALVEQSSAAAESLHHQALMLRERVQVFALG